MLTRREQDDGYVTLNAEKSTLCSQSSLVSQILTPGAHLSRETFWEDSQLRLPKYLAHSQETLQSSLELQTIMSSFSSRTDPSSGEGKWEMGRMGQCGH